ncbi:hypothetical protein APR50_31840 [Variovorax paradoxus]|nr:hypothetical protein APR50_31840 [Variovorax paradoxus]KPV01681.1 hypothetical protein APR49_30935 [Variovorax paradoxus]KPV26919.1 hypothetical protein APR48_29970 [Variovorax paradoxus]KPV28387.1 hypothetical protein APR47_28700 [Variovorax paradoxus]
MGKFFGIGAGSRRDAAVAKKRLLDCLRSDRCEQELQAHAEELASNRAKERFNSLMDDLRARSKSISPRRPTASQ